MSVWTAGRRRRRGRPTWRSSSGPKPLPNRDALLRAGVAPNLAHFPESPRALNTLRSAWWRHRQHALAQAHDMKAVGMGHTIAGPCARCSADVDAKGFCWGCGVHICERCDSRDDAAFGVHEPWAHLPPELRPIAVA